MAEADISKIIGLIMENPKLIEEIKNLASSDRVEEKKTKPEIQKESEKENPMPEVRDIENPSRIRRRELLSALKPYVSPERSRAIDSMISIADILEVMKAK